ncbi:9957_t:CDS:1, partial [Acaulospora morrowiae]
DSSEIATDRQQGNLSHDNYFQPHSTVHLNTQTMEANHYYLNPKK